MCNTKSKRNGWEGSNNVCGSNNSSPRHSSSLFLSLVHSALSRARAHQSKANKHTNKFKKREKWSNTFCNCYLLPFSAWPKFNGLCDVSVGRITEFKTTIHIGAAANSQQFSLGVHGSPWVSAVGILIMPPQGRLCARCHSMTFASTWSIHIYMYPHRNIHIFIRICIRVAELGSLSSGAKMAMQI